MMQDIQNFTGLSMPVFTAFSWAGEEAAINFALTQLELFINQLQPALPGSIREKLPHFGLSRDSQAVYLAAQPDIESDVYFAFYARPMSLEMQLVIKGKQALDKALKIAEKNLPLCHRLITELGPEWSLRLQQMQVNEETGETAHYQDLFKDSITALDEETAVAVISKAAYLNKESQWVTPLFLSRRFPSEQVAAMGTAVIKVMSEHIESVMPVFNFLTGQTKTKSKSKSRAKPRIKSADLADMKLSIDPEEGFVYVAELKPLHIRRGFINLTPEHWPFFSINSRTETRPVTIYYNGIYDKGSSVWRLVPNDQARIVLSPPVRHWIEEYFEPDDRIQVVARKIGEDEIQISLKAVG